MPTIDANGAKHDNLGRYADQNKPAAGYDLGVFEEDADAPRAGLSSGHFSLTDQTNDVVGWLRHQDPDAHAAFCAEFPEWDEFYQAGGYGEQVGLDPDYGSWAVDWIEGNSTVTWDDGEPYHYPPQQDESEEGNSGDGVTEADFLDNDGLLFARENLGPDASYIEVRELAAERARIAYDEHVASLGNDGR